MSIQGDLLAKDSTFHNKQKIIVKVKISCATHQPTVEHGKNGCTETDKLSGKSQQPVSFSFF